MLLKRKWRTKLKSVLLSVKFYYLFIAPRPTVSYHCCCASRSEFLPHATFGVWRKKIPRWSAQSSVRKKNTHDNYTNNNSPFFLRQVYMCYDSNPRNWSVPENAELIEKKFQGMPENLFDFFTESLLLRMTRQRRKFGSKIMKNSCRFMIILKSRRVKRREENIFVYQSPEKTFSLLQTRKCVAPKYSFSHSHSRPSSQPLIIPTKSPWWKTETFRKFRFHLCIYSGTTKKEIYSRDFR